MIPRALRGTGRWIFWFTATVIGGEAALWGLARLASL